ncbi:MAG: hypothetical protein EOP54_04105 [Sphingobacteriales bacterium]|nr:MAG: hypothetical protein EOP54_04105 [Sphingobacteriales bacterium]
MKRILHIAVSLIIFLTLNSCEKNSKNNKATPALNTWRIDVNTHCATTSTTFTQITGTFSTQGYQLLEMKGEDNSGLVYSRLRIFFNTIGPPPSGTYTVTSYDKLATVPNAVAIINSDEGKSSITSIHEAAEGQTIPVIFANGTLEVKFNDLNIVREGNWCNAQAKLSVNLRK